MMGRGLRLEMGEPANLLREKKVGIDAGGCGARPESNTLNNCLFIPGEPRSKESGTENDMHC